MAEFKLTLNNPKTGKSRKHDVSGEHADALLGRSIGETVIGDSIGLKGYELMITGGSDNAGFPLRSGIQGSRRQSIFTYAGVGFSGKSRTKKRQDGLRVKRTVHGMAIANDVSQVNLKVVKTGEPDLFADAEGEARTEKDASSEKIGSVRKEAETEVEQEEQALSET